MMLRFVIYRIIICKPCGLGGKQRHLFLPVFLSGGLSLPSESGTIPYMIFRFHKPLYGIEVSECTRLGYDLIAPHSTVLSEQEEELAMKEEVLVRKKGIREGGTERSEAP